MNRNSFIRLSDLARVKALVTEARRVGYHVKTVAGFSHHITDHSPEAVTPGAEVFRAVQVRPGVWAISYSLSYWEEPAAVMPATPENFAKTIHAHP